MSDTNYFTQQLMAWAATNKRPLPWKGIKDPYRIWLSEIILQQTTVRQGLPYYEKFIELYPSVTDLAEASQDAVFKAWEGLGYYSRARNLHATAKHIAFGLDGVFPSDYQGILALKGVGPYTAAAIASFAFDLPHAVVDGNVYRVLARYFGIHDPIDSPKAKNLFADLAHQLLDKNNPASYNQAIMDFGATLCTPAQPACLTCPLKAQCRAFEKGWVLTLPKKSKKIVKKDRFFNYLVINKNDTVFIRKRDGKDIWQDLYEFPMVESTQLLELDALLEAAVQKLDITIQELQILRGSKPYQQILTHQRITAAFWEIKVNQDFFYKKNEMFEIKRQNLFAFSFPKIIDLYLKDKILTLF